VRVGEPIARQVFGAIHAGVVVGVYGRAANLRFGDRLVTVAAETLGGLPSGLSVRGFSGTGLGLRAGQRVDMGGGWLRVDDVGFALSADRAEIWSPRIAVVGVPGDRTARRSAVQTAAARLSGGGLLPLLSGVVASDPGTSASTLRVARPMVGRLGRAVAGGELGAAVDAGAGLIGLGQGLTPSGDDLLIGLTATLAALGDEAALPLARAWASVAPWRTGLVASELHRQAAAGAYSERLHDLTRAVLRGPTAGIPDALDRAAAWGATSGRDTILGVALGLAARTRLVPMAGIE
jgi:hypothetical protein